MGSQNKCTNKCVSYKSEYQRKNIYLAQMKTQENFPVTGIYELCLKGRSEFHMRQLGDQHSRLREQYVQNHQGPRKCGMIRKRDGGPRREDVSVGVGRGARKAGRGPIIWMEEEMCFLFCAPDPNLWPSLGSCFNNVPF